MFPYSDKIIVCDNGTGVRIQRSFLTIWIVKAGYAGDNVPRVQFPSLIGRPMLRAEEDYVGNITLKVRATLDP